MEHVVGNCPKCGTEITTDNVYSGSFQCPNCDHEGPVFELDNVDLP